MPAKPVSEEMKIIHKGIEDSVKVFLYESLAELNKEIKENIRQFHQDNCIKCEKNTQRNREKLEELIIKFSILKTKAGIWGAIAGSIPALIAAVIWFLTKT